MQNLNELRDRIHAGNAKWWTDLETGERIERNRFELLALVVSELSECLEGERKGCLDTHLTHRLMAEVEAADTVIRLADYAGGMDYDLAEQRDYSFQWAVPENKGQAIYAITEVVFKVDQAFMRYPGETISWIIWMIEAYCLKHGYNLWGALEEKLLYNQSRLDHQPEARRQEGGKKF